ncbi:MAG: glutamate racemase [Clostridiales bacterium]|nr:glutamate racemase [Clostridiales bacterium]
MQSIDAPIGIFDSGIGGLTVTKEIMTQLPDENIIYFGDTARVPYGSKSKDTIIKYSKQIIRFLKTKDVKAIVIACNTASAFALEEIKKELNIPIIGVVQPGAKVAADSSKNGKIGIIGTEGTIVSKIYSRFIEDINPNLKVIGKACPLFVPLVEEGFFLDDPITEEIASRYLTGLRDEDIDTLILGCTHYPLIRNTIQSVMGEGVTLVNPAHETARELKELLAEEGIKNSTNDKELNQKHQFYVSDAADRFKQFASNILSYDIEEITQINIEEY